MMPWYRIGERALPAIMTRFRFAGPLGLLVMALLVAACSVN